MKAFSFVVTAKELHTSTTLEKVGVGVRRRGARKYPYVGTAEIRPIITISSRRQPLHGPWRGVDIFSTTHPRDKLPTKVGYDVSGYRMGFGQTGIASLGVA
jgi:hypothetical protein